MIRGQDLKQINVGQAVIGVSGPGEFPEPGLGTMGVIIDIEETRWGIEAIIKWQDGSDSGIHSLNSEPEDKGIGVYIYPPKAA